MKLLICGQTKSSICPCHYLLFSNLAITGIQSSVMKASSIRDIREQSLRWKGPFNEVLGITPLIGRQC